MQTTKKPAPHCSFCFKGKKQAGGKLVAGPGVHICESCVGVCQRVFTGKPTAPFSAWGSLGDEELLEILPAAASAVDVASDNLRDHVQALRKHKVSWERIASALGVSRQAAWERFSSE